MCEAVWDISTQAINVVGPIAVIIEREDAIPSVDELLVEVDPHGS